MPGNWACFPALRAFLRNISQNGDKYTLLIGKTHFFLKMHSFSFRWLFDNISRFSNQYLIFSTWKNFSWNFLTFVQRFHRNGRARQNGILGVTFLIGRLRVKLTYFNPCFWAWVQSPLQPFVLSTIRYSNWWITSLIEILSG